MTSPGELAASITHEVLQPISAIGSNGEASLHRLLSEIDEVREGLESMVADAHRAAEIAKCIRSLAKKSKPERRLFDLNQMLDGWRSIELSRIDLLPILGI